MIFNNTMCRWVVLVVAIAVGAGSVATAEAKLRALIVDGQNNHLVWPKGTVMMKHYLEETGLFTVDVARTQYLWKSEREAAFLPLVDARVGEERAEPEPDPEFRPRFSDYDVVISNFGWKAAAWPEATRADFERYVAGGGGFVVVHAADNSWPEWPEFNRMIGLGGWGDRTEKDGPYVYYNADGEIVRDDSPGMAGKHGPQNEFIVTVRDTNHPIMRGLPTVWLHSKDECYSRLRGPAEEMTILATASDTPELQAAGRHEPMLMTIGYHKGRVFHTTLGHDTDALEGVGFIVTFQRGTEWAATGRVTQPVPPDFPDRERTSARTFATAGMH